MPDNLQAASESRVGLTDLLGRLSSHIRMMAPHQKERLQGQLLTEARDSLQRILSATDSRVVRIAKALAEGCDARSFSSEDAKWLHRRYEEWKDADPPATFTDARHRSFADFIVFVLGS